MKTALSCLMLCGALCAAPGAANCAGIATASVQVSLTISDACRIDNGARGPAVHCLLASPAAIAPRAELAATSAGPLWTITF